MRDTETNCDFTRDTDDGPYLMTVRELSLGLKWCFSFSGFPQKYICYYWGQWWGPPVLKGRNPAGFSVLPGRKPVDRVGFQVKSPFHRECLHFWGKCTPNCRYKWCPWAPETTSHWLIYNYENSYDIQYFVGLSKYLTAPEIQVM